MAREAPGGRSRVLPRVLTAASLVLLAAAVPSAGFAVGDARDDQYRTADFDLRSGKIAPSVRAESDGPETPRQCDVEQLRDTKHVDSPSRAPRTRQRDGDRSCAALARGASRPLPAGLGRWTRPGPGRSARPQRAGGDLPPAGGLVAAPRRRPRHRRAQARQGGVVERRLRLVVARRTSADRGQPEDRREGRLAESGQERRSYRLRRRQPANGCERLDVHACRRSVRAPERQGGAAAVAPRGADTGVRDRRLRRARRRPRELSADRRRTQRTRAPSPEHGRPCGRQPEVEGLSGLSARRPEPLSVESTRAPTSASSGAGRRGRPATSRSPPARPTWAFRGTRSRREARASRPRETTTSRRSAGAFHPARPVARLCRPTNRRARRATTSIRGRTSGLRRSAIRRTSSGAAGTTSTPRPRTSSRCTTGCTIGRSISASTRSTGTPRRLPAG